MEPLWSPVVATGGNQRQIDRTRKARKQGETVATSCQRLPEKFHGKEGVGVDGSSPSEGSKKACKSPFRVVCAELRVRRGSTRGARSGQFAALSLPDRLSIACFRQPPGRTRVARAPTIMVRGRRLIRGKGISAASSCDRATTGRAAHIVPGRRSDGGSGGGARGMSQAHEPRIRH